ncbi:DUF4307 domain-containing protein [Streptomyces syringium]|uniref:DUF4307 domain-containing protein n=1 Tax=Streptomyces syringium TaxID=76729 RepID=UPI0037D93702
MAAVRDGLPEGRYGRTADERADRKLKIVGAVLGTALLGLVGWFGVHYVTKTDVSGELVRSKSMSDTTVQAVLEVRKEKNATAVCTLRSLAGDGSETGRKDVRFDRRETHFTELVTLRTTQWAAATKLEGCTVVSNG